MFRKIRVGNFKCIKEAELDLGKITVLIGPNESGKSSILHALVTVKQLKRDLSHLGLSGAYVELGNFEDVVFKHEDRDLIQLGLEWDRAVPHRLKDDLNFRDEVCNISYVTKINPSLLTEELNIKNGNLIIKAGLEGEKGRIDRRWIEPRIIPFKGKPAELMIEGDRIFPLPTITSSAVSSKDLEEFNQFMSLIEHNIENIYLIPISRIFQNFAVDLLGESAEDIFAKPTSERPSALLSTLAYKPKILEKVNAFMDKLFHTRLSPKLIPATEMPRYFPTSGRRFVTLRDDKDLARNLANEGAGLVQLLCVLAQVALAREDAFVMIEEPETSLHPRAQAKVMDIMLEILGEGNQLLITTHSEHILFRLLTHVASGKLNTNELAVWYFEKTDGVKAEPYRLEIDERGMIKGGLRGFFEHGVEELREYLGALSHEGVSPE